MPYKRQGPTYVEVAEHTRKKLRRGRQPKPDLTLLYKLTRTTRQHVTLRHNNVAPYASVTGGANYLTWHTNTGAIVTGLPMHVYDLSEFMNTIDGTFTLGNPVLGSVLIGASSVAFNNDGLGWGIRRPTDSAGNTKADSLWELENMPGSSLGALPALRGSFWEYVDIRMLCYGRTNKPTRFNVSVIQILDDELNYAELAERGGSAQIGNTVTGHLETCAAPFMFNPLMVFNSKNGTMKWKIIAQQDFVLGSITSIEGSNTVPHMKELKMFIRPNRIQRYDWLERDIIPEGGLRGDDDFLVQQGSMKTAPTPKSRYFLVVRAQSEYTSSATNPVRSTANHGSYDLVIRTRHTVPE